MIARALPWLLLLALVQPAAAQEAPQEAARRALAPEVRLGLWLTQEASLLRTTHLTPGLRLAGWIGRHVEVDGGYQLGVDRDGTERLHVWRTLHAFDLRAHWLFPLRWASLSLGGGPVGYLETSQLFDGSSQRDAFLSIDWGLTAAAGVETWLKRRPVRFEAGVASRGRRIDWLFDAAVGF